VRLGRAVLAGALALCCIPPARAQDSAEAALRPLIAGARAPLARWPDFSRHADGVARLYASRADAPLWHDGLRLRTAGYEAILELNAAGAHGLDPGDYDAPTLDSLARALALAPFPAGELVRFDLLLTVAMLRYLDDLRSGRVPYQPFGAGGQVDLPAALGRALQGDSVSRLVAASAPRHAQYRSLQRLLARYRRLAADSSLRLPRPGRADIAALRRLLTATGDRPEEAVLDTSTVYGPADAEAIRRFQRRHALSPDGILGPATRAELEVPLGHRVRQIELALERLRWLPPLRGGQAFLVVNIPAFELFAFDSAGETGMPALRMRVVVGKAMDTRTPLLFEHMRYVEFRPYWNVPRSILTGELLPLLRRNPGYLRAHDMEIVAPGDRVLGSTVNPDILRRLAQGELRVRQRPGPLNALGLLKFIFPNAANVSMHGTPQSELFARERRDFSHGCIRVSDPAGLATWLLRDRPEWNRDGVEAAMRGAATRRVVLTRPLPVAIFYITAVATPEGSAMFYPDIYGFDRALDESLRGVSLHS
jgi:murein L,D-transpeptidase YcbB/YkuD